MKIEALMTRHPHCVNVSDSLQQAAEVMWNQDCGFVPVVDGLGTPVAALTDRDICMSALTQGKPLHEIPVHIAMSDCVFTARTDDSIDQAQSLFAEQQIRRLPILDASNKLVGVLSINDLARALGRSGRNLVTPKSVATTLAGICRKHEPKVAAAS